MAGPTRHSGCFALLLAAMPAVASAQPALRVDGTEFVLTAGDGRVMRSHDLVGATLQLEIAGRASEILIRDVRDDRESVGRVVLHHFLIRAADGPRTEVCAPDAKGESLGFPVPDGRGGFEITCTGGAVAKCIRFGYRPWDEVPGGPPLKALHAACIRMVRADYGGQGESGTRDGTEIEFYDRWGIQTRDGDTRMSFEAAWGTDGAMCVAHARIPEIMSLEQLATRYPRLEGHTGPSHCSEDAAFHDGRALLLNRSRE